MATYASDGSMSDVQLKITAASAGDTITIPAGSFTWGAGGTGLSINKAVRVIGAGKGVTNIIVSATAPSSAGSGIIGLNSNDCTFGVLSIDPVNSGRHVFVANGYTGWRVTEVAYNQTAVTTSAYFLFGTGTGLFDACDIRGGAGNNELFFTRGPTDAWQTADPRGTANMVYIEDCNFSGPGYVCDANSNASICVRECTITGDMKIDGHGKASNTPARSFRWMEAYRNTWAPLTTLFACFDIRGGSGRFFDNTTGWGVFSLHDYACTAQWPNFGNQFQTLADYPIDDQVGVGADPKAAASEPVYLWNNRNTGQGAGAAKDWTLTVKSIPAGAITRYRAQTGDPAATFTMNDIIRADREFFKQNLNATFNGTTGVGRGTRAQMDAITPTTTGVGFWVTNEGNWDTTEAADSSGRLYVWNGSAWILDYTPYTYPHPLRGALFAPVFVTNPVDTDVTEGNSVTLTSAASGNPSPSYQWRKGGVDISGATSASYTIATTTISDSGVFDCVATNSQDSATSASATLTVRAALDTTPPTPSPSVIASITVDGPAQVTVTAGTAVDAASPPVQYNHAVDGAYQGWQSSPVQVFAGLTPATLYSFNVKARDAALNETVPSAPASIDTPDGTPASGNPIGNRGTRARRLGIF